MTPLLLRLAVIAAAPAGAALGVPSQLLAVLSFASFVNTGQLLASVTRSTDPIVRLLLASMFVVVSLILMGLVLNETPSGLTTMSWTSAWALMSILLLIIVSSRIPPHRRGGARMSAATLVALTPALAGLAGAFAVGGTGVRVERETPLLEFSAPHHKILTHAQLLIRSVNVGGRYLLRIRADREEGAGTVLHVGALKAQRAQTLRLDVALPPAQQFWSLTLQPVPGTTGAERKLILWK